MKRILIFVLIMGGGLLPYAQADTLYLNDGSVLRGNTNITDEELTLLSNPIFGEVSILNLDILYHESAQNILQTETFTMVDSGAWVIHQQHKAVPERKSDSTQFRYIIPGTVQTLHASNGVTVPYTHRVIGGNTLITIAFDDINPDTTYLTITSQRSGLVYQSDTGELQFKLKYIPNQDQTTKIIVRYPNTLTSQSQSPPPTFTGAGLVIWEQNLKRQQNFQPTIQFRP